MKLCMFWTVHHQELSTVLSTMVYVMQVCRHEDLLGSCLQPCMTYTFAECTVNKLLMMDVGTV